MLRLEHHLRTARKIPQRLPNGREYAVAISTLLMSILPRRSRSNKTLFRNMAAESALELTNVEGTGGVSDNIH